LLKVGNGDDTSDVWWSYANRFGSNDQKLFFQILHLIE